MDELILLDAVERYLRNEMNGEEKAMFEKLRQDSPDVDQLVVEHQLFLREMEEYADHSHFRSNLHQVHQELEEAGAFKKAETPPKGKLVQFWHRNHKTISVAATIAGITAIAMSGLVNLFSPSAKIPQSEVKQLSIELNRTKLKVDKLDSELKEKEAGIRMAPSKRDGTGFLVDGSGYLVTNVHVVKMADSVYVENTKGEFFKAAVVHVNDKTDVAILKIDDKRFTPLKSLPYGLRNKPADIGEEVFTLGFPRPEIVYDKGYLSAKTGYNGDTISYQVAIAANPGNSGAPLFNNHGEVIGVVSGKQTTAEGVVFAVKSKNIFNALDALKENSNYGKVKVNTVSHVKHLSRVEQIRKMEECVFIVKSY